MKGMWRLAIVTVSVLSYTRQPVEAAPGPETLVTVEEVRRRLPADSVDMLVIDGVPFFERAAVDSLPMAEVVSAHYLPKASGCSNHGNGT